MLQVFVEGQTDEFVVEKILNHLAIEHLPIKVAGGKTNIVTQAKDESISKLHKYNQAAQFMPWLVVIDLDDEDCPVTYRNTLLPQPTKMMMLRIAVRETEAWLLADREHIAKYIGVNVNNVPVKPDDEVAPKRRLLDLVRRKSPRDKLYQDMIPSDHSHRRSGRAYPGRIEEFVNHPKYPWRPEIAVQNSDSLRRCMAALRRYKENPPY